MNDTTNALAEQLKLTRDLMGMSDYGFRPSYLIPSKAEIAAETQRLMEDTERHLEKMSAINRSFIDLTRPRHVCCCRCEHE